MAEMLDAPSISDPSATRPARVSFPSSSSCFLEPFHPAGSVDEVERVHGSGDELKELDPRAGDDYHMHVVRRARDGTGSNRVRFQFRVGTDFGE